MKSSTALVVSQFASDTKTEADYYNILQLPQTANEHDVLTRFRQLSIHYHTDKNVRSTPQKKAEAIRIFNDLVHAKEFILKKIRLEKQISRLSYFPNEIKEEALIRFSTIDPNMHIENALLKAGLISRYSTILHSLAAPNQHEKAKEEKQQLDNEVTMFYQTYTTNQRTNTTTSLEDFPIIHKKVCINMLAGLSTPTRMKKISHWTNDEFFDMIEALQGLKTNLSPTEFLLKFSHLQDEGDDEIHRFKLALDKLKDATFIPHDLSILLDVAREVGGLEECLFVDELITLGSFSEITPELSSQVSSLFQDGYVVASALKNLAYKLHDLYSLPNTPPKTKQCYLTLLGWVNPLELLPKLEKIPQHMTALFETLSALVDLQQKAHPRLIMDTTYFDCLYNNAEFLTLDPEIKAHTSVTQILNPLINSNIDEKLILRIIRDYAHVNHIMLVYLRKQNTGRFLSDNVLNNVLVDTIRDFDNHGNPACEPLRTSAHFKAFLDQPREDGTTLRQKLAHHTMFDIVSLAIYITRYNLPLVNSLNLVSTLERDGQMKELIRSMLKLNISLNETVFRNCIEEIKSDSESKSHNRITPFQWNRP